MFNLNPKYIWLAFNYHWSEDAILSLPIKKRKRYIELINTTLCRDGEESQCMSTNNNFVGRLINRHMMIASATKGASDPIIKPVLTPEIIPDHFRLNYPLQNNSDRIVSSAVPRSTAVRDNLKESPPTPYRHETRNKAKGNDELSSNSAMNKLRTPLESSLHQQKYNRQNTSNDDH